MANTTDDRYQVGDEACGLISTYSKKMHAFRAAQAHAKFCDDVTVFDVMARRGAPDTWRPDGSIASRRERDA